MVSADVAAQIEETANKQMPLIKISQLTVTIYDKMHMEL